MDPGGEDWISTALGLAGYATSTYGLITNNMIARGVGIGLSLGSIYYSINQYNNDKMSIEELGINVSLGLAGIGLDLSGQVAAGIIVRAGSNITTVMDIARLIVDYKKPY